MLLIYSHRLVHWTHYQTCKHVKRLTRGPDLESLVVVRSQPSDLWGEINAVCQSHLQWESERAWSVNCTDLTQAACRHWHAINPRYVCVDTSSPLHSYAHMLYVWREGGKKKITQLTGEQQQKQLVKCCRSQVLQRDNNDIWLCNSPLLGLMVMTNGI